MRILTLPGLGDNHWVMLKLQALYKQLAKPGEPLEVGLWNADNKPRTLEFLERIPFVDSCHNFDQHSSYNHEIWHRALFGPGYDIQDGFDDYDYMVAFNGSLRHGRSIVSNILHDVECNWDYPVDIYHEDMVKYTQLATSPIIVLYFSDCSLFGSKWVRYFGVDKVVETIRCLEAAFPLHKLLLTGLTWDQSFVKQIMDRYSISSVFDLCCHTTMGELLFLIRRATAFVGFPSGNLMMATHFGTPTVALWGHYFQSDKFLTCWCDPAKVGTTYRSLWVDKTSPQEVAEATLEAVQWKDSQRSRTAITSLS